MSVLCSVKCFVWVFSGKFRISCKTEIKTSLVVYSLSFLNYHRSLKTPTVFHFNRLPRLSDTCDEYLEVEIIKHM